MAACASVVMAWAIWKSEALVALSVKGGGLIGIGHHSHFPLEKELDHNEVWNDVKHRKTIGESINHVVGLSIGSEKMQKRRMRKVFKSTLPVAVDGPSFDRQNVYKDR